MYIYIIYIYTVLFIQNCTCDKSLFGSHLAEIWEILSCAKDLSFCKSRSLSADAMFDICLFHRKYINKSKTLESLLSLIKYNQGFGQIWLRFTRYYILKKRFFLLFNSCNHAGISRVYKKWLFPSVCISCANSNFTKTVQQWQWVESVVY